MGEKTAQIKRPDRKKKSSALMHGQKHDKPLSSFTSQENILYLQQTIGNQAVQRLLRSASQRACRSTDISKLSEFELEEEYNSLQQRFLSGASCQEADAEYLETIESEIGKRQAANNSGSKPAITENQILLNYDDFSLQDGRPKSVEAQAGIMYNWQKLEQVYADANKGNERARLFWQFLEGDAGIAGTNIARELYDHPCQVTPAMQCVIHLERFDFLRKDKPGALRLRRVMHDAFEKRAHEIELTNNLILAAANAILALSGVKAAISQEARTTLAEATAEKRAVAGEEKAAASETAAEENAASDKGKTTSSEAAGDAAEVSGEGITTPTVKPPLSSTAESIPGSYSKLTLRQLRKLAVADPEAAEALRLRYRAMSDRELAERARRGDAMAKSVRSQRIPPNEELQKILGSDYRPPHEATAVARDPRGSILWSRRLSSGNMTPAEEALGFPQNILATHTEARAVAQAPLVRGGTLSISGQYDPCGSCRRAMAAAAQRSGATIIYWWPGGRMVFWP